MFYAILGGAAVVLLLSIVFLLRTDPETPRGGKAPERDDTKAKARAPSSPKPLDAADRGDSADEVDEVGLGGVGAAEGASLECCD